MKRLAMRGLLLCLLAVESSYAPPSHPQLLQQYAFHKVFRVDVQQGQEPASARLYFGKQQFPKELKPQQLVGYSWLILCYSWRFRPFSGEFWPVV